MPQAIIPISVTPFGGGVPKANALGKIAAGWLPDLSGTYQPLDSDLTTIAALAPANGTFIRRTGGAWVAAALTSGDIPDLSATYLVDADIGVSVQGFDSDLAAIAALASTGFARQAGAGTWAIVGETGSDNVVRATSPTIVTPTVASLTNMQHNHQNAAGGGSLDAAAIGSGTLATARTDYTPAVILAPGSSTRNAIQATGNFIALVVKASGTGTPTQQEWQDASGTALARITAIGGLELKSGSFAAPAGGTSAIGTDGSNNLTLQASGAIELIPVTTAHEIRIRTTVVTFTGQTSAAFQTNNGSVTPFTITNLSGSGAIKVIVKAGAAQSTNNLLEVQDSSANVMALISSVGGAVFNEQGNDADSRIEGDTDANLFVVDAGLDFVGIGVLTPGAKLHIVPHATDKIGLIVKAFSSGTTAALVDYQNSSGTTFGGVASSGQGTHIRRDGGTATTANVLTVGHNSSGTPAASFGGAIQFQLGSSTTPDQEAGRIRAIWTTATHASRVSNQIHSVYNISTEVDILTLKPQNVTIAPAAFDPASATNTFVALNMAFNSSGGVSTNSNIGFSATLDVTVVSDPGARTIKAFDALMRNTVGSGANYGGTLMGFHGEVYNDTANRTITNAIAIDGVITVGRSGGTITNGYAVRAQVDAGTGTTLTSGYGFYFKSQAGAGTYTNLYGLYLEAVAGAATLNYALYTNAGLVRFGGDVVLADVNLQFGTTTGTKHGTTTSQKQSFWNATPIIQPAAAAQALVATTAATQTTPWGYSTAAQADGIITLLNEIRNVLVNTGLMKGAA